MQKLHIGTEIAPEVIDGCHVCALMLRAADIQTVMLKVQDIGQIENRGMLLRITDQLDQHLLLHDIGIHKDVAVRDRTIIEMDGLHALLTIQIQDSAVPVPVICLVGLVIKKRHIRSAVHMLLQKLLEVLLEDHVAGCNNHIGLLHSLNDFNIVHKSSDIRIINCIHTAVLIEQELKLAALGIDVVMLSIA